MQQNAARIKAQGLGLAAISYDSVAILKQFADRAHITFTLLSDPDSAVIRSYGILNETVAKTSAQYGIPHPGTYILDRKGAVVAKYFQEDFRVRDTADSILLRQFGLKPLAQESLEAKHATLQPSALEGELRPNQRVTLNLDVTLPRKVHVYAPGVQGYKAVALTLGDSKAFQAEAAVFPKSRIMNLAAIHESVPVFENQFRIMQTITLAGAQQIEPLLDCQPPVDHRGPVPLPGLRREAVLHARKPCR